MKPQAVVDHEPDETLLGSDHTLTIDHPHRVSEATHAAPAFAAQVSRYGEGGLVQKAIGSVVVLHFNAIIRVEAR